MAATSCMGPTPMGGTSNGGVNHGLDIVFCSLKLLLPSTAFNLGQRQNPLPNFRLGSNCYAIESFSNNFSALVHQL